MNTSFYEQKVNEAILFIAQKATNMFNILKVLYFADKEHLSKYGRFITNDDHVVLDDGPVPSYAYDLIKHWRDGESKFRKIDMKKAFDVSGTHTVKPRREPLMEYLSETDIECLDNAIKEYGFLTPDEMSEKLKTDKAYQSTSQGCHISIEAIAKSLPNGESILEYLSRSC